VLVKKRVMTLDRIAARDCRGRPAANDGCSNATFFKVVFCG